MIVGQIFLNASGSISKPARVKIITSANLRKWAVTSPIPSICTRPMFCIRIPVRSIPIRRGRVVRPKSHPPKFAAIVKVIKLKSWLPGAAAFPIIAKIVA